MIPGCPMVRVFGYVVETKVDRYDENSYSNHRAKRGGSLFEVAFGEAQRRSRDGVTLFLRSCLIFWNFLTKIAGSGV